DGDKVELSNLNRQAFDIDDIGLMKAEALKNKILKINPSCSISINTHYIRKSGDVETEIENNDIVINTIDCNKLYFDIIEYARNKHKLVICPFNPGFAGMAICFTYDSAASYEMFDLTRELNDIEISRQLFDKFP